MRGEEQKRLKTYFLAALRSISPLDKKKREKKQIVTAELWKKLSDGKYEAGSKTEFLAKFDKTDNAEEKARLANEIRNVLAIQAEIIANFVYLFPPGSFVRKTTPLNQGVIFARLLRQLKDKIFRIETNK